MAGRLSFGGAKNGGEPRIGSTVEVWVWDRRMQRYDWAVDF